MKNHSLSGSNGRFSADGQSHPLLKLVKSEKMFSKVARQAAFNESVAKLPLDEAVSRAKLIGDVDPTDFRIVRMPG